MKKLSILTLFINLKLFSHTYIQNEWSEGPGILVTTPINWKGFWKGANIHPYRPEKSLVLLKHKFELITQQDVFGTTGAVEGICVKDINRVFVAVNRTDSSFIHYSTSPYIFTPQDKISIPYNYRDINGFILWTDLPSQNKILWVSCLSPGGRTYYSDVTYLPSYTLNWSVELGFEKFTIWLNNSLWGAGGNRVYKYENLSWEPKKAFSSSEYPGFTGITDFFSDTTYGLFALLKFFNNSIYYWRIYRDTTAGMSFGQIIYNPADTGYPLCAFMDKKGNIFVASQGNSTRIFLTPDMGGTWFKVFESYEPVFKIPQILQTKNGIYYFIAESGTSPKGRVYYSYDGKDWQLAGSTDFVPYGFPSTISEVIDDEIWIGTHTDPEIIAGKKYADSGFIVSSFVIIKKDALPALYKSFEIDTARTNILIKARTCNNIIDTIPWDSIPYLEDTLLTNYPYVKDGDSLFQYRIDFQNPNTLYTPVVNSVKLRVDFDSVGPVLIKAIASDGEFQQNGKDPDDRVYLIFDEPTDKPFLNAQNVDSIFPLSGTSSWTASGFFDTTKYYWNSGGDTLLIFLSYVGTQFASVEPGDTVCANIHDRFGFFNKSCAVIEGSFDDIKGPYIKQAIASDGTFLKNGIDEDDYLMIIFSEKTNRPNITTQNIDTILKLSGGKTYGDSIKAVWQDVSIYDYDSLRIDFFPYAGNPPTLFIGDTITPNPISFWDNNNNPAFGFAIIEGTFDLEPPKCDSVIATDGFYPEPGIGEDDFVVFYFTEPVITKETLNSNTINIALQLSNNNTWTSGNGEIGDIILIGRMLFVFFSLAGGAPTVSPGDTVFINPLYFEDISRNPLIDTVTIGGNFSISNPGIILPYPIFSLKLSSNLWREDLKLSMQIPETEKIKIDFYDISGRRVKAFEKYVSPEEDLRLDIHTLPVGVYFLKIEIREQVRVFKGIKIQ